jgi:hypothetical protein
MVSLRRSDWSSRTPVALPPPYGVASGQRSTNLLERSLKSLVGGLEEVKRRPKVIGRFPGEVTEQGLTTQAVRGAARDAQEAGITPETTSPIPLAWGVAWQVRSAAWMLRHRRLLEEAIQT